MKQETGHTFTMFLPMGYPGNDERIENFRKAYRTKASVTWELSGGYVPERETMTVHGAKITACRKVRLRDVVKIVLWWPKY
jgi:hypothetical protein